MSRSALGPYIWDPAAECVSRSELEQLQAGRLGETVRRAVQQVPFYRNQCTAAGVDPSSVRSLDDLRRIPFTVKDDLRAYYPFDLLAVPKEEILRLHTSTGTTGRPTLTAYTRRDLELYVTDIEESLLSCPHTTTNFQVSIVNNELLVRVELHLDEVAPAVADAMSQRLAVRVRIESVKRGSIPRSLGKAARIA